ncbi:4-(cytidine 5'-diphospho)-2-C-methyl-D-erythritol kinase [Rhizomicrobium electricum]|uniref:4-diphosphocytidyl-2-C-methyl-D-erythritol kinase n=1 Tax=Rhizomicrobium electricum TaxID=480070 RepID=A0ABN1E0F0_9PROT|nr:4-(cytidine 5'-diphospho)-2-C-methyl-D-erythritol kinase [Rhizomicrobium electricum]NIJ47317.1 4-diphosphocytidyl-2-C-methyl-D-erythritol kinase [Rhizomicrobium electricum]
MARAPAKINLFLHVGDKRADGFHALQSLVAFTEAGDDLAFAPDDALTLAIDGPFGAELSAGDDNLVVKAARVFEPALGAAKGAHITLTKNLPVASGIGGGSADCAATLRGLNALWGLGLDTAALQEIGASLGSDVPVCITCQPQWMEGRGEILTELPALPDLAVVLVNPGVGVPTGKVFGALKERRGVGLPLPPKFASADDLVAYLKDTANDLEAPARVIAPVIGDVLDFIAGQGALLSRMSGSGATCFGLFENGTHAARAAEAIRAAHPGWWAVASRLSGRIYD